MVSKWVTMLSQFFKLLRQFRYFLLLNFPFWYFWPLCQICQILSPNSCSCWTYITLSPVAQCSAWRGELLCSSAYGGWFVPCARHSVRMTYRLSAALRLFGSLRISHNKFCEPINESLSLLCWILMFGLLVGTEQMSSSPLCILTHHFYSSWRDQTQLLPNTNTVPSAFYVLSLKVKYSSIARNH